MDRDAILDIAREWMGDGFDQETRNEIRVLFDEKKFDELYDRFRKSLEFGTGGMRGLMGAGTNRMNRYTVGLATQGLANYLNKNKCGNEKCSAVIAYDSRNNSKEFARETACVLAGNGIKVYIFPELRPTPLLSYAVRYFKASVGVVITASHDPKEYSGNKVYGSDGCQVVPPEDKMIVDEVGRVSINQIRKVEYKQAKADGMIVEISRDVEDAYIRDVVKLASRIKSGFPGTPGETDIDRLKIVYTPLHGTGITMVPRAVSEAMGIELLCEKVQSIPDGNFPTTVSPNPEEHQALERAIEYAASDGADFVLATDPDCDRLAIAIGDGNGGFKQLTGNQIGCLFAEMLLDCYKTSGSLPENPMIISTIVSTELISDIVKNYGVGVDFVLTGFKYIGEKIRRYESEGKNFLFGFEESYGYLADTFVRDKDGVIGSVLSVLMIQYALAKYGSIFRMLEEMYRKYGIYKEYQKSFVFEGEEGEKKIGDTMEALRNNPPSEISGGKVFLIKDYKLQKEKDLKNGTEADIKGLPVSNVLQFYTDNGIKISARPSGTEPKIKFYFQIKQPFAGSLEENEKKLDEKFEKASDDFFRLIGF